MSDIFNENNKWKLIANKLGYHQHLETWQKSRNPTKVVLLFAKVIERLGIRSLQLISTHFFL